MYTPFFLLYVKHCFIDLQLAQPEESFYVGLYLFFGSLTCAIFKGPNYVCTVCNDNPETLLNAHPVFWHLCFPNTCSVKPRGQSLGNTQVLVKCAFNVAVCSCVANRLYSMLLLDVVHRCQTTPPSQKNQAKTM